MDVRDESGRLLAGEVSDRAEAYVRFNSDPMVSLKADLSNGSSALSTERIGIIICCGVSVSPASGSRDGCTTISFNPNSSL